MENSKDESGKPYLKKIIYLYSDQDLGFWKNRKRDKLLAKDNKGKTQDVLQGVDEEECETLH